MKIMFKGPKTNFALTVTMATLLVSCSSQFKRPESFQEKMSRFKSRNLGRNIVPKTAVDTSALAYKASRGPASVQGKKVKKAPLPYNNKKLYFLTLLDQYESLKSFSKSETAPTLEICPKFHSTLVYHKEEYQGFHYSKRVWTPNQYDSSKVEEQGYLASHPELLLPVNLDSDVPTVGDMIKKGNMSKEETDAILYAALDTHLKKTYSEIQELCEYGNSNNYYNYENLMTFVKGDHKLSKNAESAQTLLQTTIFSNISLKKSIFKNSKKAQSRGIASVQGNQDQVFEQEIVQRLGVNWSIEYFDQLMGQ